MERSEFAQIAKRAYELNLKGKKLGVWQLADDINAEKLKNHDIFEIGIKLVSEGVCYENIIKVLTNKINIEQDASLKLLKNIQKEAVLCIYKKYNSFILINTLLSYIDDKEKENAKKQLKEKIFSDYFNMY